MNTEVVFAQRAWRFALSPESGGIVGAEAVAHSAANFLKSILEFCDWRAGAVVEPCCAWLREELASWTPMSVSMFGSGSYYLELPSSDFDVCVMLHAGRNTNDFMKHLKKLCNESPLFTCTSGPGDTDTYMTKFMSVWVDIRLVKCSRAMDGACQSSDRMKLLIESRMKLPDFKQRPESVHMFKLFAHKTNILHRHMTRRGGKFKAICLCFWAWAVLDGIPPSQTCDDCHLGTPMLTGTLIVTLVEAFRTFDWANFSVVVAMDTHTRVVRRATNDGLLAVPILLDGPGRQTNMASNVTLEHIGTCRKELRDKNIGTVRGNVAGGLPGGHSHILAVLQEAADDQDIDQRTLKIKVYQKATSAPSPGAAPPVAAVSAALPAATSAPSPRAAPLVAAVLVPPPAPKNRPPKKAPALAS